MLVMVVGSSFFLVWALTAKDRGNGDAIVLSLSVMHNKRVGMIDLAGRFADISAKCYSAKILPLSSIGKCMILKMFI